MSLRRNAKKHQGSGVESQDYWAFNPGQHVMTREGFAGIVTTVEDGPYPGVENYVVALDNGLGGGDYSSSELTAIPGSVASVSESGAHSASDDYPELSSILRERPPLEHLQHVGSLTVEAKCFMCNPATKTGGFLCDGHALVVDRDLGTDGTMYRDASLDTDGFDLPEFLSKNAGVFDFLKQHPDVENAALIGGGAWLTQQRRNDPLYQDTKYKGDTQNMRSYHDWCAFRKDSRCHYPKDFDVEATAQAPSGYSVWKAEDRGYCPRRTADEQKTCPVGAPGPDSGDPHAIPAQNITDAYYQIKTSSKSLAMDGDNLRFHLTATWRDVQAKAKAIKADGKVRILSSTEGTIAAQVEGDLNVYQTVLTRVPGRQTVAVWECGCAWASYSWGRTGKWKKYEGRMCSHALALTYEAQARGMFGKEIREDKDTPHWLDSTIPVKQWGDWDRSKGRYSSLDTPDIPPIVAMAGDMIDQGEDPSEIITAFAKNLGLDRSRLVVKSALTIEAYRGKIHNRIVNFDIEDGKVMVDGQIIPAGDVLFPNWDPQLGLHVAGSLNAEGGWVDDKFVDYDKNRPRNDPKVTRPIKEYLPEAQEVAYSDMPFLNKLHQEMGTNPVSDDALGYIKKRKSFFSSLPLENVPLDNIVITQPRVNVPIIDSLRKPPNEDIQKRYPNGPEPASLVRYNNQTWIIDGHHRTVADALEGKTTVPGHVWDLDAIMHPSISQSPYARAASLAAMDPDALEPPGPFGSYNMDPYGMDSVIIAPAFDPAPLDDPLADDLTVVRGGEPEPALPFIESNDGNQGGFSTGYDDVSDWSDNAENDEDENYEDSSREASSDPKSRLAKLQAGMAWLNSDSPRGGNGSSDDFDISGAAKAHLAKTSAKKFTPSEQARIIGEGVGVQASNLDRLDISGTHYEALEHLYDQDDEPYF